MLCDYGCGKEAIYQLKNGKWCCQKSQNSCDAVKNKVVIEIKTVGAFTDVHTAQALTYLKLGNYKLGLLLNFYVSTLKDGIKRIIN